MENYSPDMDGVQTQEQHQPTPSPPEEHDPNLWGYLQRYPGNRLVPLERYDLRKDCPVVTVGRDPRNTICIPHIMSAFHATIRWNGVKNGVSQVTIEDNGSRNKTFVEGTKVKAKMKRAIKNGAEISFALAQIPPPGDTTMQDFRFIYHDLASPARGVLEQYHLSEESGRGNFSIVYKAYDRKEGNLFAVKSIHALKSLKFEWNEDGETVTDQQLGVQREIDVMKQLTHPNVCRLLDYFWNADGSIDLVLDYMPGGDLFDFIARNQGLSERMTKHLMRQLCEALAFIHSKNITHRDLKPENILLTADRPPILKIADFGLAKMVDPDARLQSICGTPMYLAPEFALHRFHGSGYGVEADCFSAGGVCYNCVTFMRPIFSDMPEGKRLTMEHVTPDRRIDWRTLELCVLGEDKEGYPIYLSSAGRAFIRGLLEEDPQVRLTMVQALQHAWLQYDQADSYVAPRMERNEDACEELTSSLQEVTMRATPAPDTARNATVTPSSQQQLRRSQHPEQEQEQEEEEAAPGLTRLQNKGRVLERQRDVLARARAGQRLFEPSLETLRSARLGSVPSGVEACMEAGPSSRGGVGQGSNGNKRKYSALTPPPDEGGAAPTLGGMRRTASPGPQLDLGPVMKKGKGKSAEPVPDPDAMDVSPRKQLRRRVGR
ncbi:kinase-like domain-containing protein [Mycena capillaripes]|nr:kinase-like domain-containing protein [Mycena capillaripes]